MVVSPIILLFSIFPIAWLISEFKTEKRWLRILLGILTPISCVIITWNIADIGTRFNYNAWYGNASKKLLDTVVGALESEESDLVLRELKVMQEQFRPSAYRSDFDRLVTELLEKLDDEHE